MSTTYSLVCDDCKVKSWVGQSRYFYDSDFVCKFMHEHAGHRLRLINDLVDDDEQPHGATAGYEEIER